MSLDILNAAGNAIRDGARFDQDTLSDRIIQDYPAAVRPVDTDKAQEVGRIADVYYGDAGFEAAQVFLPDASGMFPWDASCDPKCAAMQTSSEQRRVGTEWCSTCRTWCEQYTEK